LGRAREAFRDQHRPAGEQTLRRRAA
jgi:hypothetical protein